MKEHIEYAEEMLRTIAPAGRVQQRNAEFLRAAIALMNAAKPLDDAAEMEHCRTSFERDMRPLSGVQPMHAEWLMRERALARAEGYEAGCEAGSTAQANADQALARIATDNYAKLAAQLSAAQAELEEATHFGGYTLNVELRTKLSAPQAEIEALRTNLVDADEARRSLQVEIERQQNCVADFQRLGVELETKLTNLRTAAERFAWSEDRDTQDLLDAIKESR